MPAVFLSSLACFLADFSASCFLSASLRFVELACKSFITKDLGKAKKPKIYSSKFFLGQFGFLLPANQIKPVAEEMWAGLTVMADAVIAGTCNRK
jgi:hypothetical protein